MENLWIDCVSCGITGPPDKPGFLPTLTSGIWVEHVCKDCSASYNTGTCPGDRSGEGFAFNNFLYRHICFSLPPCTTRCQRECWAPSACVMKMYKTRATLLAQAHVSLELTTFGEQFPGSSQSADGPLHFSDEVTQGSFTMRLSSFKREGPLAP
jgi:hypothetical protein